MLAWTEIPEGDRFGCNTFGDKSGITARRVALASSAAPVCVTACQRRDPIEQVKNMVGIDREVANRRSWRPMIQPAHSSFAGPLP
ncbi:MAG: hypothetical protein CL908_24305 [Deltaproteobacteria bacterium]|nr:hypothetical protein [Deltaproteobacteria bacterium]